MQNILDIISDLINAIFKIAYVIPFSFQILKQKIVNSVKAKVKDITREYFIRIVCKDVSC